MGEDVLAEARRWLGVRFQHTGRDGQGLDCVGLLIRVANDLGLIDYDYREYPRIVPPSLTRSQVTMFCDEVRPVEGEPRAGDVLLFTVRGAEQHVGISNGAGGIVNARMDVGYVVEHDVHTGYGWELTGVFRLRGLDG